MSSSNRARVKLYSLNESNVWVEMGTGYVTVQHVERLQSLSLTVRSESDGAVLLESRIMAERTYQKTEDNLIMWTEEGVCEIALSFREASCCNEVWEKICLCQKANLNMGHSLNESDEGGKQIEEVQHIIELPPCEMGKLDMICDVITGSMDQLAWRENLALILEEEEYIQKLLDLFLMCEDLGNTQGLHHLYNIFRTIFVLNKSSLLSVMFHPDNIMNVVGCLEYDPSKAHPVRHRQYLQNTSRHKDVIGLDNLELLNQIHLTYKIMYIQEVILPTPSLFEENLMSALNSIILFSKTEIVKAIQDDKKLLYDLFSQLCSDSMAIDKYRELCLFLRELCHFAQALEIEDCTKFYHKLCEYDMLSALLQMLTSEEENIITIAVDILNQLCECNSAILREHILKQTNVDEDGQLLNVIIGLLADAQFSSVDVQLVGVIKTIIDPEIIMTESNTESIEKTVFLNHFYAYCMHQLMAPLMAQTTTEKISKDTVQNATLLGHVLDILSLCVERHSCHIRSYVIEKNILGRVLVLMTSSHGHLALASLRFCRKIIGLKNEFYNRYIVRNNLFAPIIKSFMTSGHRYNLINSAIIELFEYIRSESIIILVTYVVEKFMSTLESIQYVETFQLLKLKYDQEMDRANDRLQTTSGPAKGGIIYDFGRYRRDPRDLDEDEESWFDDEEEAAATESSSLPPSPSLLSLPRFPQSNNSSSSPFSYSPRPSFGALTRSPLSFAAVPKQSLALQSLVDYDEDSDEDQSSSDDDETPPTANLAKRIKLDDT